MEKLFGVEFLWFELCCIGFSIFPGVSSTVHSTSLLEQVILAAVV